MKPLGKSLRLPASPLLQWFEIWPPGMDWEPVQGPCQSYCSGEGLTGTASFCWNSSLLRSWTYRQMDGVYIPLDDSNYANDWYQDGGWGYDETG